MVIFHSYVSHYHIPRSPDQAIAAPEETAGVGAVGGSWWPAWAERKSSRFTMKPWYLAPEKMTKLMDTNPKMISLTKKKLGIWSYGYGSIPIYRYILVGWISIYQLFWCSPGVPGFWHTAIFDQPKWRFIGKGHFTGMGFICIPSSNSGRVPWFQVASNFCGMGPKRCWDVYSVKPIWNVGMGQNPGTPGEPQNSW